MSCYAVERCDAITADVYDDMLQWSGLDRGRVEIRTRGPQGGAALQPDKFDAFSDLKNLS